MAQPSQAWDPSQYTRFAAERAQPFWDLAALLAPVDAPAVVDLGCGDGRLTAALHTRLGAASTLGVDSSPAMLEQAAAHDGDGLSFLEGDIASWRGQGYDIVYSNAALHWVPDHRGVLQRWTSALRQGGQLAVQVPANAGELEALVAEYRRRLVAVLGEDEPCFYPFKRILFWGRLARSG